MERLRRRLVSAASTLAFGLGVTMAGSFGATSRGIGILTLPASTAVEAPRRDPFGDRVTPTEPNRRPRPDGPAPGVRVSAATLPPLPRYVTAPSPGGIRGLLVAVTASLTVIALLDSWKEQCPGELGFLRGWACVGAPEQFVLGLPLIVCASAFVAATLELLRSRPSVRRRFGLAASTLAFGLGVTMAGSMGIASRGFMGPAFAPIGTLSLVPLRRDPFGDRVTPREPHRRPVPAGPAPGVRVSSVALPPLPHGMSDALDGEPGVLAVALASTLLVLAALLSVEQVCPWLPGFLPVWPYGSCAQHFTVTPYFVGALALFVGALVVFARARLRRG